MRPIFQHLADAARYWVDDVDYRRSMGISIPSDEIKSMIEYSGYLAEIGKHNKWITRKNYQIDETRIPDHAKPYIQFAITGQVTEVVPSCAYCGGRLIEEQCQKCGAHHS